jgi:ribonuclease-3
MQPLPHEFSDPELLELALTHASTGKAADNERLEFLGDAALDLVVAEELYRLHPDLAEGDLTELKAWVVSRRTLAEAAQKLELEARARVGRGLDRRALSRSVLANLYEAVLGAVYLDAGLEAAAKFTLTTLADPLQRVNERREATVPKQVFQEHCQRRTGEPPRYEVVESRGKAHARAFLVRALSGGESFPTAWGRTRKEAEHWAAQEALLTLEERA